MKVLFFASLRERLQCDGMDLEKTDQLNTAQDVIDYLAAKGEPWQSALTAGKLLIAVNQEMVKATKAIKEGDEIAFFPPVTGG